MIFSLLQNSLQRNNLRLQMQLDARRDAHKLVATFAIHFVRTGRSQYILTSVVCLYLKGRTQWISRSFTLTSNYNAFTDLTYRTRRLGYLEHVPRSQAPPAKRDLKLGEESGLVMIHFMSTSIRPGPGVGDCLKQPSPGGTGPGKSKLTSRCSWN